MHFISMGLVRTVEAVKDSLFILFGNAASSVRDRKAHKWQEVARKMEIKVLEKNNVYATVEPSVLDNGNRIVADTDRFVESGDRVRIKEGETIGLRCHSFFDSCYRVRILWI